MSFWTRRIAETALTLVAVSLLAFLFVELAPGDYVDQMRLNPRLGEEALRSMRESYGLDRPFLERYGRWIRGVANGTWGFSFAYGAPVAPLIWTRAVNTLLLSVGATVLAWALALPAGLFWASHQRGRGRVLDALTSLMIGVPEIVLSLALLVVAERTRWFPIGGMRSIGADDLAFFARTSDVLWHLALPVVALAIPTFAVLVRHVRAAVTEILDEPYVNNARALGITGRRLIVHHVLRPAANPLLSVAGLSIASLFSASLIVEVVMGWPGLGPFLLEAIRARDVHVVIGGVMCSAVLVAVGGLLTDLFLFLNDPRIALS